MMFASEVIGLSSLMFVAGATAFPVIEHHATTGVALMCLMGWAAFGFGSCRRRQPCPTRGTGAAGGGFFNGSRPKVS
jgi:hypothetical protein